MRDIDGHNKARADAVRAFAEQKGVQLRPLELDVLSQDSADARLQRSFVSKDASTSSYKTLAPRRWPDRSVHP